MLAPFLASNLFLSSVKAFECDIDANKSSCKFTGCVSCEWGFGSSSFPSVIVSWGEDDSNATKIVVAFASIVAENVIPIDGFIEYIIF